jgi:hypothetical protein
MVTVIELIKFNLIGIFILLNYIIFSVHLKKKNLIHQILL